MNDLLRRNKALEKTAKRFRGKVFKWGANDCAKMARCHLINMGHKPPKIAPYQSAIGAHTSLKKTGFDNLEEFFDSLLPRIAPASMRPGDIALLRGTDQLDSIMICVGRKLMGWAEGEEELIIFVPSEIKAAWRA